MTSSTTIEDEELERMKKDLIGCYGPIISDDTDDSNGKGHTSTTTTTTSDDGNNNNNNNIQKEAVISPYIDELRDLDPYIPDKDYAEFIIRTVKKTVKREDSLVRQIVYTALSKDSSNPQNLAVLAPTSEGKTHAVLETLKTFPKNRLWKIGSMSPKVIIRQNGILVDSNNELLEPRIKEIKRQMRDKKTTEEQKEELQDELNQLYNEAKVLIDLTGWLFVFLEPPHPDTWNILKPILSHDDYEIEHPYVYEVQGMGFKVKKIVTRGWPACIFCSARNESKWPAWPEIQSRFLITSPNMIKQKYLEGNILIAQRKGLPRLVQQSLIVSDSDIELAKKCFIYLIEQIKNFTYNLNLNPVWIPYTEILGHVLPSEKGPDNRIATRILDFIIIITLSRAHLRSRLQYGNESLVIADVKEDLHEVLHITQNISGMPTYKLDFFKKYVLPVYKAKTTKDKSSDGTKEETIIAITTREVCEYYKEKTGKSITTNNVKETYFNEFINNGLMDYVESVINKSQYVYYPIVDLPSYDEDNNKQQIQLTTKSSIPDRMDDLLQHPKLLIPKNYKKIPENWLELEILALLQHPVQLDKFGLYNENNEKICICKFIKNYENQKSAKLTGCFSEPEFYDFHSEIFGNMKYLPRYKEELCRRSSSRTKMDEDVVNGNGSTIDSYDDIEEESSNNTSKSIYRLGHSDTYACHNCKQKGDKWFMQKHMCKGLKK